MKKGIKPPLSGGCRIILLKDANIKWMSNKETKTDPLAAIRQKGYRADQLGLSRFPIIPGTNFLTPRLPEVSLKSIDPADRSQSK